MTDIPLHSSHRVTHFIIASNVIRGKDIHGLFVLGECLGVRGKRRHLFLETAGADAGTESDDDVVEEIFSQDEQCYSYVKRKVELSYQNG